MQVMFEELGFGMFIHYNMATYVGQQWVSGYPEPSMFNPGGTVDTDAWADAAKSAGMTYAVLTAKHVSGFCLWDSQFTNYSVMHPDCPYQKDLVAQFIESFTSRGLKVGLYYCWRNPGFDDGGKEGVYKVLPPECDPASHTFSEQVEFQKAQIRELVENYPDVFYIWNDALDSRIMPREGAKAFAKSLGSRVICSANWWDWAKKGDPFLDVAVKEQRHFPEDNAFLGETCWTLEDAWFWHEGTSTAEYASIRKEMHTAVARNSNFLLNIGPDKAGLIVADSREVLAHLENPVGA